MTVAVFGCCFYHDVLKYIINRWRNLSCPKKFTYLFGVLSIAFACILILLSIFPKCVNVDVGGSLRFDRFHTPVPYDENLCFANYHFCAANGRGCSQSDSTELECDPDSFIINHSHVAFKDKLFEDSNGSTWLLKGEIMGVLYRNGTWDVGHLDEFHSLVCYNRKTCFLHWLKITAFAAIFLFPVFASASLFFFCVHNCTFKSTDVDLGE